MNLSASDISLAISDPFGLWHNHRGDQTLKDPLDEFDLFLLEQGLRVEAELLLEEGTGIRDKKNGKKSLHHDLDSLAGSWTKEEAEEFDKSLASQRTIDLDLWR